MTPERATGAGDWSDVEHAAVYLARADALPHRREAEGVVDEIIPRSARRILDLGTGDGRLISVLQRARPDAECVAIDVSPPMLEATRTRFADEPRVGTAQEDGSNRLVAVEVQLVWLRQAHGALISGDGSASGHSIVTIARHGSTAA